MKILFISTMKGYPWGGSEELWSKTAKEAIEQGNEVWISIVKRPVLADKLKELKNKGANVVEHRYLFSRVERVIHALKKPISDKPIKSYVKLMKFEPDVICISQGGCFDIIFDKNHQYLINTLKKPYCLIVQHNTESRTVLHGFERIKAQEILAKAAKLFFVSVRNLQVAERQLAFKLSKVSIISNPVNVFRKEILPWPAGDRLLMACVARYDVSFKGQDLLLQALSHENWKYRNFTLGFYGKGHDESYLRDLINYYGLSDKIFLAGHVSEVDNIWMENQLLILPSISEGTPLALIEAQLCGRPALGTDVGDMCQYINSSTGFKVSCPTVPALSEALENMWQNKEKLMAMGEVAYNLIIKKIDLFPEKTLFEELKAISKN